MKFIKSVKFRLTAWYLIVILVLLGVFSASGYLLLSRNLHRSLDNALTVRAAELRTTFSIEQGHAIFAAQPTDLILIYNSQGDLFQRFGPSVELPGMEGAVQQALQGQDVFLTMKAAVGQEFRLYAIPFVPDPRSRLAIILGRSTSEIETVLDTFRYVLGVSGLTAILLAAFGGLFLATRVLKPVDRITRAAQEIGEHDLTRRIDVHGEDELGRLAGTLNGMIGRLEAAFERQRQFTADASHELRTPLAIMQAESTLALSKERSEAEYRKALELISQEISYMTAIIGKLLFLARSDAGKEPLTFERTNLKDLLTELAADIDVLARDKDLKFTLGAMEDLSVKGDSVKLRQLFLNIMQNAVRYTPNGGSIFASLTGKNGMAEVSITDTGIGIAPEHLPHLFERFYRVDKARSRAEGGAGLGLAIAKYIAGVHGGRIDVSSEAGKGSTFSVYLPLENSK
ncbi:MAG: ATP-binding protein [Dehalococcoidales bacterium]|nr:ATP-binding protein [Dehalococcoidales bacterium]